jgi:SNF2 family DNA or RNA helicase
MRVITHDANLALEIEGGHFYHEIAKHMAKRRWLPAQKLWVFPPLLVLMQYVKTNMPALVWDADADARLAVETAAEQYRKDVAAGKIDTSDDISNIPMRLQPYEHQRKALVLGRNQRVFAYLMDQGTGKTKVIIDDAAHNYRNLIIDAVLILAPNSVKTNWVNTYSGDDPNEFDEVRKHMAPDIQYVKAAHFANPNQEQKAVWRHFQDQLAGGTGKLLIMSVNVEGLTSPKAQAAIEGLVKRRKVMIVVDESTRIGNRSAERTKIATAFRKLCPLARIASGTPVIKSPLKAFSQFGFLDPNIIGIPTYTEFAARHAVMQKLKDDSKREVPVRFVNTEELADKIAGVSFRVLKEQCLDLPPKTYLKRNIYFDKVMELAYKEMRDKAIIYLSEQHKVEATTVLTQLLRLQQITAGYLPILDPVTNEQTDIRKLTNGPPPKIKEAVDMIEEFDGKVIVWCKFKFEIQEMNWALEKAGIKHVLFYGGTPEAERVQNRMAFQNDPSVKVFVGQVRTGGIGLTLTAASNVIYLSNTFSTEDRVQSEDRAHRIGQTVPVTYYDLITPRTVDEKIIKVLRSNKMLSDEIMRDGFRQWI